MLSRIVLVFLALYTVRSQKPSPCPNILVYESRNSELDRWNAIIYLNTDKRIKGIWLTITLDRPAELLGNAFGEATTKDNREFLIMSQNYILEAGNTAPIRFFVKYNAASIVPSVAEINLNGNILCPSIETQEKIGVIQTRPTSIGLNNRPTSQRPVVTNSRPTVRPTTKRPTRPNRPSTSSSNNFRPSNNNNNNNYNIGSDNYNRPSGNDNLNVGFEVESEYEEPTINFNNNRPLNADSFNENNRYPDNSNNQGDTSSSNSENSDEFFAGDFSATVSRPPSNPSFQKPTINREHQCGTLATQARPLISYGQNTTPGQWPWHAALYHSKGIQLMYTCGGTLISKRHILTAAHCVTKPRTNRAINPQNILVYLGKYNLKKFGSEIQDKEVSDIYVHPEYNSTVYHNDIAILRLAEPAQITNYVRPVCLWEDVDDLNQIEGQQGTVVGWGFDHNKKLSTTLMQAQMPIVSTVTCIYSNREFFSQFTSEKSFCAGFKNGTSVCNGDSGGGMVFPKRGTGVGDSPPVWQIRGLVSVGVALQGQGVCDPSQFIVFTDVAKHIDWIQQVLSQNR